MRRRKATVRFPVGKSIISASDKQALKKLATDAASLNGYLIEVKGFADSSGNAVMNQKLSENRAQNVVAYLIHRLVERPAARPLRRAVESSLGRLR